MLDPGFFWQLQRDDEGQFQSAYQVLVATSKEKLEQGIGDTYDSKKVKSRQNTHVVYNGKKLEPATNYFWKVIAWDKNKKGSEWSEVATFSTGLWEHWTDESSHMHYYKGFVDIFFTGI